MDWSCPPHWEEGMALLPQHFQGLQHHLGGLCAFTLRSGGAYRWGLRRPADLQLSGQMLELGAIDAVMPSGVHVHVPDNARAESRQISDAMMRSERATVYLAVAQPAAGASVVRSDANPRGRYIVDDRRAPDENMPHIGLDQPIRVRTLSVRLLLGDEPREGYEAFPIGQLLRGDIQRAEPYLDERFVPPLLCLEGEPTLGDRLRGLCDDLWRRAAQIEEGIGPELTEASMAGMAGNPVPLDALRLMALNTHVPVLDQLRVTPVVHPMTIYLALTQLCGALALFGRPAVHQPLPPYDHEAIDQVLNAVIRRVKELAGGASSQPSWSREPFEVDGDDGVWRCAVPADWLKDRGAWRLFLGAHCTDGQTTPDQMRAELARLKIAGSIEQLDRLIRAVLSGVRLKVESDTPPRLSDRFDGCPVVYAAIDPERTAPDVWSGIETTGTFCFRNPPGNQSIRLGIYAAPRRGVR